jgi:hypothetical protein
VISQELKLNNDVLVEMADFLVAKRADHIQGQRLPAAIMRSHMGATVDRKVYQPKLREILKRSNVELSVVVPVASSECTVISNVLNLIGGELWKEMNLCIYNEQVALSRKERVTDTRLPKPPIFVHMMESICEIAAAWRGMGASMQPVHVMLLLEDFASIDSRVLKALFQFLKQAQFDGVARGKVNFSVILWASAEVELQADLLDCMYLTEKPFLPAATMLNNVLFAVLVEPKLPFVLPASVYKWILEHFTDESHSLAWLLHILHALVFDYFSFKDGSWAIQRITDNSTPVELEAELQRLIFPLRNVPQDQIKSAWHTLVGKLDQYRADRFQAFVDLWTIVRECIPDYKGVLEAYGDYLEASEKSKIKYEGEMLTLLRQELLKELSAAEASFEKTKVQLAMLLRVRPDAAHLQRAQQALLKEDEKEKEKKKRKKEEEDADEEGEEAEGEEAEGREEEEVRKPTKVLKPKDLLLAPSTKSQKPNSSVLRPQRSRGGIKTVRSNVALSQHMEQLLGCVKELLLAVRPFDDPSMLGLVKYQGTKERLQVRIFGNHRQEVMRQLEHPQLGCSCCVVDYSEMRTLKRGKLGNLDDGVPMKTWEDVSVAFAVCRKGNVDIDNWERLFLQKLELPAGEAAYLEGRKRFHRAVKDLQSLGVVQMRGKHFVLGRLL